MGQRKIQADQLDPSIVSGSPIAGGGGSAGSPLTAAHPSPFTVQGTGSPIPTAVISLSGNDAKLTANQGDLIFESLAGSPVQTELVAASGPLVLTANVGSPKGSISWDGANLASVVGPLVLNSGGSPLEVWLDRGALIASKGSLFLGERTPALANKTTYSQLWSDSGAAQRPMWTTGAGVEAELARVGVLALGDVLGSPAIVSLANGTAAAPSLTFLAETSMGAYRIGPTTMAFVTGGVEKIRILEEEIFLSVDSGVNIPGVSNSATDPNLKFGGPRLGSPDPFAGSPSGIAPLPGIFTSDSQRLSFVTANLERLRIGFDGTVSVLGSGSPIPTAVLSVVGNDAKLSAPLGDVIVEGVAGSPIQTEIVSAAGPLVLSAGSPVASLRIEGGGSPVQTELVSAAGPLVLVASNEVRVVVGSPTSAALRITGSGSNEQVIIGETSQGNAAAPSLAFSDGDTGLYEVTDDALAMTIAGAQTLRFGTTSAIATANVNGPSIENVAASSTVPTLVPNQSDDTTGIGVVLSGPGSPGVGSPETTLYLITSGAPRVRVQVDQFRDATADGPAFNLGVPGASVAGLIPRASDSNTGIGTSGADALTIVTGSIQAMRFVEVSSSVLISNEANVGLTAAAGSSQGDGVITSSFNVYSTVTTTGDAATLPAAFEVGTRVYIKNDGVNSMDVFPASGDDAGAGTDTAVAVAAGTGAMFMGTAASATWTQMY